MVIIKKWGFARSSLQAGIPPQNFEKQKKTPGVILGKKPVYIHFIGSTDVDFPVDYDRESKFGSVAGLIAIGSGLGGVVEFMGQIRRIVSMEYGRAKSRAVCAVI